MVLGLMGRIAGTPVTCLGFRVKGKGLLVGVRGKAAGKGMPVVWGLDNAAVAGTHAHSTCLQLHCKLL